MPATSSLIPTLANDYPQFTFAPGSPARWSPDTNTIYFEIDPQTPHARLTTLHELAHALLGHASYTRDIELLAIESEAWEYATRTLAPKYHIPIDPEFVESQLDTYRDWIHTKSTCPHCGSNGIETDQAEYSCPHCGHRWHTNAGIDTAVRRYNK